MKIQFHYRYSSFWAIFWIIICFPVALMLLLTGATWTYKQACYRISYGGSRFWLGFWTLLFFPVALLLLFLKGLAIEVVPVDP